MTEWILSSHDPYPWHESRNIAFKGYVWKEARGPLTGDKAAGLFAGLQRRQALQDLLGRLDGVFSVIIRTDGGILTGCDSMGFFPVFYAKGPKGWVVADDPYRLTDAIRSHGPNIQAHAEFLSGGHVLGNETLAHGISRLRPGEAVYLKSDMGREGGIPFAFIPSGSPSLEPEALKEDLHGLLNGRTHDMTGYLGGRTAVVPLSGGYDSRLIACMLKKAGYEKVVCFTYGRPTRETELSERVARSLGYPWIFVDYDKLAIGQFTDDPLFRDYCRYAGNLVSMPFLQEYFAVKFLKDNRLVPTDSIFLPGHPGDNLGGSFISRGAKGQSENIARHIARTFFPFRLPDKRTDRHLEQRVRRWYANQVHESSGREVTDLSGPEVPDSIDEIPGYMPEVETWNFSERLPKLIFNSARVFPFFGYRVFFPLWSLRLAGFFSQVPYPLREGKKLYDEVLEVHFFKPFHVCFGQAEITSPDPKKIPPWLKKLGWRLLPHILLRRKAAKNDWICYGKFTAELGRSLKARGKKPLESYRSLNALVCQWYLENEWE